ncbi:hypothetical protein L3Q82_016356, partial [Scortum barcoo]
QRFSPLTGDGGPAEQQREQSGDPFSPPGSWEAHRPEPGLCRAATAGTPPGPGVPLRPSRGSPGRRGEDEPGCMEPQTAALLPPQAAEAQHGLKDTLQLLQVTHREGATGSLKIPTPSDTNWSACCHLVNFPLQESVWLKEILSFITEQVHPLLSGPAPTAADNQLTGQSANQLPECGDSLLKGGGVSPDQLSVCVVKKIQEITSVTHTLPVSYRPVSVSELLSRQHLACVSNLSWSTNQQRVWAKEAELSLPGHRALPRVNLLLIGCLREGRGGEWRLTDASGSVRCEVSLKVGYLQLPVKDGSDSRHKVPVSPSPSWLNWPVFLPHWNYIPHDAREQDQDEAGGHVELIGSPVLLCHGPQQGLALHPEEGAGLSSAVGVTEASRLLQNRTRGQRVSVCGQVGSVCPLLVVAGRTFFCFALTDGSHRLPVLVKVRPVSVSGCAVVDSVCVCAGQSVCVTALRVCVLRGWRGNNILCVTEQSEIHTDYTHRETHTHTDSQSDTPPSLKASHVDDDDCEEAESESDVIQSSVRMKYSRVISYQGTVTEVVSEGAGLYVIDKKVGLCLAYQPTLRRRLRAGDSVEVSHSTGESQYSSITSTSCIGPVLTFLPACSAPVWAPASGSPPSAGRGVGGSSPDSSCPGDGVLPRLLLEKNMGVSEYLWVCHLSSQLSHSLVPSVLKQQCVCVLSWKLMECVWRRGRGGGRRDIYSEMLDEPHTCPLTQVDPSPSVYLCLSLHTVLTLQCLFVSLQYSVDLQCLFVSLHTVLTLQCLFVSLQYSVDPAVSVSVDLQCLFVSLQYSVDPAVSLAVSLQYSVDSAVSLQCLYSTVLLHTVLTLQCPPYSAVSLSVQYSVDPAVSLCVSQYSVDLHTVLTLQCLFVSLQCLYSTVLTLQCLFVFLQYSVDLQCLFVFLVSTVLYSVDPAVSLCVFSTVLTLQCLFVSLQYSVDLQCLFVSLQYIVDRSVSLCLFSTVLTCSTVLTLQCLFVSLQYSVDLQCLFVSLQYSVPVQLILQCLFVSLQYSVDSAAVSLLLSLHVDPAVHQYISLSELSQSLQSECWSSVSLSSLLPPGGSSLTRSQINTALAWSCRTMTSFPQTGNRFRQRPLLLVGVLELPSLTSEHTLQLRDRTGAVACVTTETSEEEEGGQRAAFNTAWIGCLVCVRQFTMVTERFIQSDFPSYQHLDQDKYIMHKHCRVEQKEGVAWKNEGAGTHRDEAGLIPCFSVRAAVIGPVVSWGRDPKNGPMTDRETETEDKLVLLFSGVSLLAGFLSFILDISTDSSLPTHRLTVCDQTGRSLQVYLDLSHTPYPPGLLPGNTLLLSAFQRRVSRSGSVYCSYLPVSSISVISLGETSSARPPPAPMMHLVCVEHGAEVHCGSGQRSRGVFPVPAAAVELLAVWECLQTVLFQFSVSLDLVSLSVQSKVRLFVFLLVIDDGTGEAHVWFSGALVRPLLGLADSQWEGLQRALRVRGHVRVYPRGRSLESITSCLTSEQLSTNQSVFLSQETQQALDQ